VNLSRRRVLVAIAVGAILPALARAQQNAGPYVPTPWKIVDDMLRLASVRKDDYVMDLGSGDGRLVITAAERYGARGAGVDIDPALVKLANDNAAKAGVADRVKFEKRDLFETNLADATVLTLYLLPHTVTQLVPRIFAEMRPGSRVVSHDYPLACGSPSGTSSSTPREGRDQRHHPDRPHLYIVPARVGGAWRLELPASGEAAGAARVRAASGGDEGLGHHRQPPGRARGREGRGRIGALRDPGLAAGGKPLALEGIARGNVIEGTAPLPVGPWRATKMSGG
jgi:SAM-dependent methyltransferase